MAKARLFAWFPSRVTACSVAWYLACSLLVITATTVAHAALAKPALEEMGIPFIRNFSPADYGGAPQNFSVIQDQQGIIYVGNGSDGLFAFDGSRWRRIPIPNRSAVRSLAMDDHGRVYVGDVGDFGYLERDAEGRMHYVSLLNFVPAKDREFTDVWRTLAAKDGIYFVTRSTIFRFEKGVVKTWKAKTAFVNSVLVNDVLYVHASHLGLMRLDGKSLELIPGGGRFADNRVVVLLPWKGRDARPGELLIGTNSDGWWRFDGEQYQRWSAAANAATKNFVLYEGLWLQNGQLALAGLKSGVLLLDESGHLIQHLTRANGLDSNAVTSLFEDSQGGLWLTSEIGVARISVNNAISSFDERNGLAGVVLCVERYNGSLYVGTSNGLFRLEAANSGSAKFEQIKAVKGEVWSTLDSGHGLLVGGSTGLNNLRDGQVKHIRSSDSFVGSMIRLRRQPNRIVVGLQPGLSSLIWDGRQWLDQGALADINDGITSMAEDDQGALWLGTDNSNVLRVTLTGIDANQGSLKAKNVDRFSAPQGIRSGDVAASQIDGKLRIASSGGILFFDFATHHFKVDPRFAHMLQTGGPQTGLVHQDAAGKVWMYIHDISLGLNETGAAVPDKKHQWRWVASPLQPLAGVNMQSITTEPDGVVWFGAEQGLYRYAPSTGDHPHADFSTLLRAIISKGVDGTPHDLDPDSAATIPYKKSDMRFEFAAPSFDTIGANRFETQLQGLDNGWSPWSSEAYRDYTNIPDGDYRFQVRAKNVYGVLGTVASFDFRVMPPWYRTWWAWTMWFALTALGVALLVYWRSAALHKRNRTLASLVNLRTSELQQAITALSEQSVTDPLTGLKNRRYLQQYIEQDIAIVNRQYAVPRDGVMGSKGNMDLTFLMLDIDYFKIINDKYGHAAGDLVLQQLCDLLLAEAREIDTPIRWGGEEFLIMVRRTNAEGGAMLAERLRSVVAAHSFDLGGGVLIRCTCSIGFASYPFFPAAPDALNWEQVLNLADTCMYAAKRRGRNDWVGTKAGSVVPQDITVALRESLDLAPDSGPLVIISRIAGWEGAG